MSTTDIDVSRPTRSTRRAVGAVISEISSPVVGASATQIAASLDVDPTVHGLVLGVAALTFACALPLAVVLLMVRRGHVTDHHIRVREQRPLPLAVGMASTTCGIGLLVLIDAPGELLAVVISMLIGLAVALLISLRWKASIHLAVWCGSVSVMSAIASPWWLTAFAAAPAIAWARVTIKDHTWPQTLGGAAFGTAVATVTLPLLLRAWGA